MKPGKEDYHLDFDELMEGAKRMGPGSPFWYRCMFDPIPTDLLGDYYGESTGDERDRIS